MPLSLPPGGPSGRGWSDIGPFLVCPQRWAYRALLGLNSTSPAQALGILVHLAMAAHYLRVKDRQEGREPVWLPSRDAARAGVAEGEAPDLDTDGWVRFEGVMSNAIPKRERETHKILAVEDFQPITLGTLECEGHPKHGQPIIYCPRLDLVTEDSRGRVWITDHKTAASPSKAKVAYNLHGQFLAMRLIGRTVWGTRFGGIRLHMIKTVPPYDTEILELEPAPVADRQVAQVLFEAYHRRAGLEMETKRGERSAWEWPKAFDETVCYHRYGKCFGWDYCCWGSGNG